MCLPYLVSLLYLLKHLHQQIPNFIPIHERQQLCTAVQSDVLKLWAVIH
jgi:hypothetical protein